MKDVARCTARRRCSWPFHRPSTAWRRAKCPSDINFAFQCWIPCVHSQIASRVFGIVGRHIGIGCLMLAMCWVVGSPRRSVSRSFRPDTRRDRRRFSHKSRPQSVPESQRHWHVHFCAGCCNRVHVDGRTSGLGHWPSSGPDDAPQRIHP